MSLFGGVISINNIYTLLVVVFSILLFGYAFGRITVKGISLGDAGVFIIALVAGALFFSVPQSGVLLFDGSATPYNFKEVLKVIEALGLVLFVTSVGYIAGPKFFGNFKKNFKSYVLLGLVIILAGGLAAAGASLYYLSGNTEFFWSTYLSLPDEGFNGIPVALLAANNPIAVVFAGVFMSMLNICGMQLKYLTAYNEYIADIIIAVIVYLSAFSMLVKQLLSGRKKKGGKK